MRAFQIRPVRSFDAVAIRPPSGDQATPHTGRSWPRRTSSGSPVRESQIRDLSDQLVTIHRPSGDQASARTARSWWIVASLVSFAESQTHTVRSSEAVAMRWPSGDQATARRMLINRQSLAEADDGTHRSDRWRCAAPPWPRKLLRGFAAPHRSIGRDVGWVYRHAAGHADVKVDVASHAFTHADTAQAPVTSG